MAKKQKYNIQDTDIDDDALLDYSQLSGTELDYEYSDSLLESDGGESKVKSLKSNTTAFVINHPLPKSSKSMKLAPPKEILQEIKRTTEARSKPYVQKQTQATVKVDFNINEYDYKSTTSDILDLQRMADKFAQMDKQKIIENITYNAGEFNYEIVTGVDKLLEEAHTLLYKYYDKLDRATRASLQNLILKLKDLPNTYVPMRPEKQRSIRVLDWLNNHTSQPEREMYGFSMQDPTQPRKYVSDIVPRTSASDTNVILGKRKRGCGYCKPDDVIDVHKSNSDTRVYVHANWQRPSVSGKRRRVRVE